LFDKIHHIFHFLKQTKKRIFLFQILLSDCWFVISIIESIDILSRFIFKMTFRLTNVYNQEKKRKNIVNERTNKKWNSGERERVKRAAWSKISRLVSFQIQHCIFIMNLNDLNDYFQWWSTEYAWNLIPNYYYCYSKKYFSDFEYLKSN